MASDEVRKFLSTIGALGGKARMKWTAKQRRESARKAARASVKARKARARKKSNP